MHQHVLAAPESSATRGTGNPLGGLRRVRLEDMVVQVCLAPVDLPAH